MIKTLTEVRKLEEDEFVQLKIHEPESNSDEDEEREVIRLDRPLTVETESDNLAYLQISSEASEIVDDDRMKKLIDDYELEFDVNRQADGRVIFFGKGEACAAAMNDINSQAAEIYRKQYGRFLPEEEVPASVMAELEPVLRIGFQSSIREEMQACTGLALCESLLAQEKSEEALALMKRVHDIHHTMMYNNVSFPVLIGIGMPAL